MKIVKTFFCVLELMCLVQSIIASAPLPEEEKDNPVVEVQVKGLAQENRTHEKFKFVGPIKKEVLSQSQFEHYFSDTVVGIEGARLCGYITLQPTVAYWADIYRSDRSPGLELKTIDPAYALGLKNRYILENRLPAKYIPRLRIRYAQRELMQREKKLEKPSKIKEAREELRRLSKMSKEERLAEWYTSPSQYLVKVLTLGAKIMYAKEVDHIKRLGKFLEKLS